MSNAFTRSGIGQPVSATESARADQVVNSTGGFVFKVTHQTRLMRFLILGTTGGSYYTTEKRLTLENVKFLTELIAAGEEQMIIDTVIEVSTSGRAFRNSPAIFTVAALAAHGKLRNISELVAKVCRTATHLFEFAEYIEMLGGWGRAKRTAVANWYTSKAVDDIAYQVVKYRQRNGWTHRDMLRLCHPVGLDRTVGDFILGKTAKFSAATTGGTLPKIIEGFKFAQEAQTVSEVVGLALRDYPQLPWEAIPTQFLNEVRVWRKLFENGQLKGQALLRNITRLARMNAFDDMVFAREYANALTDKNMMRKTRIHPFQYLLALTVHQRGQMDRKNPYSYARQRDWTINPVIVQALNEGFHKAFNYVEPAGKRTLIGLDISASMSAAMTGTELTAAEVAAAMAMTVARTEPYYNVVGFAHQIRDLGITPAMDLDEVMRYTRNQNFGSTDPGLLFQYAMNKDLAVDTFVVITDNEVNTGHQPFQMLQKYRKTTGIAARLVVVACTPTEFTIADPNDAGMFDISGADSNLPALIANFSAGRI